MLFTLLTVIFEKVKELPAVRSFRVLPPAMAGAVARRATASRQAFADLMAELLLDA